MKKEARTIHFREAHIYLNNRINVVGGLGYELLQARSDKNDNVFGDAIVWLNDLKKVGIDIVRFSGGEPTLEIDKLVLLISKAKSLGLYTTLKTNGWWANDEEYWEKLVSSGLDFLRVTYDSSWFYEGSPLTKQISMKAIGDGRDRFKMFAVITHDTEPDLEEIRSIGPIVEVIPNSTRNEMYMVQSEQLFTNEETGKVTPYIRVHKNMYFVIDFKGRAFCSGTGIFAAENDGTLDERYLGDVRTEGVEKLYNKFVALRLQENERLNKAEMKFKRDEFQIHPRI